MAGKDIAFVRREKDRIFPIGEQGVRLTHVFVMFTDGDWLAIDIVYTHRPEMPITGPSPTCQRRYFRPPCRRLGRIMSSAINDETHRLWVREGGIDEALAREAAKRIGWPGLRSDSLLQQQIGRDPEGRPASSLKSNGSFLASHGRNCLQLTPLQRPRKRL